MKKYFHYSYLLFSALFLFFLPQCSPDKEIITNVTATEAQKLIKTNSNNPGFMIIDVRTPEEFAQGHLPGALNIDYRANNFEAEIGRLEQNKTYLVYCYSGSRSSEAVNIMKNKGFKILNNLQGGLTNWANEKFPIVSD